MNREDIAEKMRQSVADKDKELILKCFEDLRYSSIYFYHLELDLKAKYEDLEYKNEIFNFFYLRFKGNTLRVTVDQELYRIYVTKESRRGTQRLDEIAAIDGKLICDQGEFYLNQVNVYLSDCYAKLLSANI
ncbi:hypothetical protein [Cytobacillus purgationiresistens]|uniref:DUF3942 domain-containing protein n=1 Tax=Cytobacillus purgationiresistens TaxID=863449 RepID=A0ABU0APK8_9BACI|nr:hypothetical protein [Cytobacillus purgationiresistens]MDQ0272707.1 hypothetical protein [Cytobacillus purgationiresistens]